MFRAMSRVAHPDDGGDTKLVQHLNAANDADARRGPE
jgi:hypothetical protein